MKKFIAWLVVVVFMLSICGGSLSAMDSSCVSDMRVEMNPIQMYIAKKLLIRKGLDETEVAKSLLGQVGYPDSVIQVLSDERLIKVYNSSRIVSREEYVCIDSDGVVSEVTKEQYEAEQTAVKSVNPGESKPTVKSWAKLTTYVMQSNTNRTEYSYSCACEWLTTPLWRMNDYIALGVTEGSIAPDSVSSILTYSENNYTTGKTQIKYQEKIGQSANTVVGRSAYCSYNLPNNMAASNPDGSVGGVVYSGFVMVLFMDGTMSNSPYTDPMNVSSAYFHQRITVLSNISLSIGSSGTGVSFSISPSIAFSKISNSLEWVHKM